MMAPLKFQMPRSGERASRLMLDIELFLRHAGSRELRMHAYLCGNLRILTLVAARSIAN
jgi:hypothetical protein